MKTGFFKALKQNFNDLREIVRERKQAKNTRHYERDTTATTFRPPQRRTRAQHIVRANQRKFPNQRTGRYFANHPELYK